MPRPTTLSRADSRSSTCASMSVSSEMTQQVRPAPLDLSKRQIFAIPCRCPSQSLRLGSTFHGTAVVNRGSNQRKCANSFVNFLRFFGVERNVENRSCRPRATNAFIVACSCSAWSVVSIAHMLGHLGEESKLGVDCWRNISISLIENEAGLDSHSRLRRVLFRFRNKNRFRR